MSKIESLPWRRVTGSTIVAGLFFCTPAPSSEAVRFEDDVGFLKQHTDVILLSDDSGEGRIAVVPRLQGRVMTSTAGGDAGLSYGWMNRKVIASGERQAHMNAFGGEDRFWLGPEGGQYSIYFSSGDPFDLDHWQVPEPIDWGGWEVVSRGPHHVRFQKNIRLVNYASTPLNVEVERTVRVLDRGPGLDLLGIAAPADVKSVAFESANRITNQGEAPWERESGLLSIWILGMFQPSSETTVVIPFVPGPEAELGPVVNDRYFGKVPADRLVVGEGVLYFRGDGRYRSKIGIPRPRAKPVMGSYDAENEVLTLVQYTLPETAADYVNSMWEIQDEPYRGDVVNSYNDGPPAPGVEPLGPFYELESSSPAAALAPGERLLHVHRTFHFQGERRALDGIARATLGVGLDTIENVWKRR